MLLLRQLTPLMRNPIRFYAKKSSKMAKKYIHQEEMRHIDPFARIKIRSDIFVKIRSSDVHDYPDGDAFVAELHGGQEKNSTASMKVNVSNDEKDIEVILSKIADNCDYHCELAVPVKASLNIESSNGGVHISKVYGDAVIVKARTNIQTDNINAFKVSLCSEDGQIQCKSLLLGKEVDIETKNSGNIILDKLQGDKLLCKSNKGKISVNSCYVDEAEFETDLGDMDLKNVHKVAMVHINKRGNLNMTGVHGTICVHSNGGNLNLQLSELKDENIIYGNDIDQATVNISDAIEENSYIEINSSPIVLESSLSHLSDCISEDNQSFRMSLERDNRNKLVINVSGTNGVRLGKLSWAENMRATMAANKK